MATLRCCGLCCGRSSARRFMSAASGVRTKPLSMGKPSAGFANRKVSMRRPGLIPLLALLAAFATLRTGSADELRARLDGIDFVRISAGCRMNGDRNEAKVENENGVLAFVPEAADPIRPLCDSTAIAVDLRQ